MYDSAGQRVAVEAGFKTIGHTSHDPKIGKHVYWFESIALFEKYKKDIFENTGFNKPIPVIDIGTTSNSLELDQVQIRKLMQTLLLFMQQAKAGDKCMLNFENGVVTPIVSKVNEAKEKFAPPPPPPPPPPAQEFAPPPPPPMTEADRAFLTLADRKIRINDFAAELGKEPDALKTIINSDARFAPIVGGWVRKAGENSES